MNDARNIYLRISDHFNGDKFDSLKEKRQHENDFFDEVLEVYRHGLLTGFDPGKIVIGQIIEYHRAADGRFVSFLTDHEGSMKEAQKMMVGQDKWIEAEAIFPDAYGHAVRAITMTGKYSTGRFQVDVNDSLYLNLAARGEWEKLFKLQQLSQIAIPGPALHEAVKQDRKDIVEKLVKQYCIDANSKNPHGNRNALTGVCTKKMFDLLVGLGTDPTHIDRFGDPVYHYYDGGPMNVARDVKRDRGLMEHAKAYLAAKHSDFQELAKENVNPFAGLLDSLNTPVPADTLAILRDSHEILRTGQERINARFDTTLGRLMQIAWALFDDEEYIATISDRFNKNVKLHLPEFTAPQNLVAATMQALLYKAMAKNMDVYVNAKLDQIIVVFDYAEAMTEKLQRGLAEKQPGAELFRLRDEDIAIFRQKLDAFLAPISPSAEVSGSGLKAQGAEKDKAQAV